MSESAGATKGRFSGLLSPEYLRASIAIYTTVALVAFEGTAVAAALPQVAADLDQLDLLPWIITVFLFASGVATVVAGSIVDVLGTGRVFRWAVALFSIAGFAAGLAPSMPALIVIRLIQGIGAGMVVAVGLAATSLVYPDRLSSRAFAANSTVWGVMGAAAPAIAAAMLSFASWRWIFFINLPLGLISIVAGWSVLPGPQSDQRLKIDPLGALLVATFTLATLLAVDQLSLASVAWAALAAVSIYVYARHARRVEHPIVRIRHAFKLPYSMLGLTIATLIGAAFSAAAYITLYVSAGRGEAPTLTAWSVFFFTIGWTLGANVSSFLLDRLAETTVMRIGIGSTTTGLVVASIAVLGDMHISLLFVGMVLAGSGIGLATNAGLNLVRALTKADEMGRTTSAHHFMRNQGLTLGAAIGGSVLLFVVANQIGDVGLVQELLAGEGTGASAEVADAVARGYGVSLLVALGLAVVSLVPMSVLRRHLAEARGVANGRRHEERHQSRG